LQRLEEKGRRSALFVKPCGSKERTGTRTAADLRQLSQAQFNDFMLDMLNNLIHGNPPVAQRFISLELGLN
jgi:hypothetical protein